MCLLCGMWLELSIQPLNAIIDCYRGQELTPRVVPGEPNSDRWQQFGSSGSIFAIVFGRGQYCVCLLCIFRLELSFKPLNSIVRM